MRNASRVRIHHVQLMIPRGREAEALAFYAGALGLVRIPKPAGMPNPDGLWFALEEGELHLGMQDGLPVASRAHVALVLDDLDARLTALTALGARLAHAEALAGMRRVHVWDPFGNRLELMGA